MRRIFTLIGLLAFSSSVASAQATDLFISEYIEGSSFNKAIEIYNGTSQTVDLSAYVLEMVSNGTATNTLPLTGSLVSQGVIVIAHGSASFANASYVTIKNSTIANFNGNDTIVLKHNGVVIDSFGKLGVTNPPNFTGNGVSAVDQTLRRKPTICIGDTDTNDDFDPSVQWDSFPKDTFDGLGSHSTTSCGGTTLTCSAPSGLNVSSITTTSASVNWTASNDAVQYLLGYKISTETAYATANTTATTYGLSGLASGTSYQVTVQSDCGTNGLSGVVSTSFSTTATATQAVIRLRDNSGLYETDLKIFAIGKETDGSIQIPVDIKTVGSQGFTMTLTPVSGTATQGQDFSVTQASIPAGASGTQYIPVTLVQDQDNTEGVEYIDLTISTTGATLDATPTTVTLWIKDSAVPTMSIYPTQSGETLRLSLKNEFYCSNDGLAYTASRYIMYRYVDVFDNKVCGFYDGVCANIPYGADGYSAVSGAGLNAEHIWPQSMGAGSDPMQSDMQHLRPTYGNVNSARGNYPYATLPDVTSKWYQGTVNQTAVPANPDEWSQFYNSQFEPRKVSKGDAARASFYFYSMYTGNGTTSDSYWQSIRTTVYDWTAVDYPDENEVDRTLRVATYQCKKFNPYIFDQSLPTRLLQLPTASDETRELPEAATISGVYPNPAWGQTRVTFVLPRAERTALDVYNLLGQRIAELENSDLNAGEHQHVLDTSAWASGIYLIRLHTESGSEIKRLVVAH